MPRVTGKALQIWCAGLDFTALQTFKDGTAFKLINMSSHKKDTCKWQEMDLTTFTCICISAKHTFIAIDSNNMTEFQTRWLSDFVETLKTRFNTNDFDEMCIWLETKHTKQIKEKT